MGRIDVSFKSLSSFFLSLEGKEAIPHARGPVERERRAALASLLSVSFHFGCFSRPLSDLLLHFLPFQLPASVVLDLLYPTLFAAGASLLARLLFPTTAVTKFLTLTQQAFRTSERLLLSSVDDFFADAANLSPEITNLRSLFIAQTRALPSAYDSCLYEVSFNKFAPHRLLPFLALVRRLKMDVAAGSSYSSPRPTPVRRGSDATLGTPVEGRGLFQGPTVEFVKALVDSYAVIHKVLEGQKDDGMEGARERLTKAEEVYRDEMDAKLELAVQRWEEKNKTRKRLDEELLQISLFAYFLRAVSLSTSHSTSSLELPANQFPRKPFTSRSPKPSPMLSGQPSSSVYIPTPRPSFVSLSSRGSGSER